MNYYTSYLGGEINKNLYQYNFVIEFEKYFCNLISFLKDTTEVKQIPSLSEVDVDLFRLAFQLLCNYDQDKAMTFEEYIELVQSNSHTKLSNLTNISKKKIK